MLLFGKAVWPFTVTFELTFFFLLGLFLFSHILMLSKSPIPGDALTAHLEVQ